jgi:hypothetical protein
MGGDTLGHAGFLIRGNDIRKAIPCDKSMEGEPFVFGNWTAAPFKNEHYVRLIGQTFKVKIKGQGHNKKLRTYTLKVNLPIDTRQDIPFSLIITSKGFRVEYPLPPGEREYEGKNYFTCCGKQYYQPGVGKNPRFCSQCGDSIVRDEQETIYTDNITRLLSHSPTGNYGDLATHFNLREETEVESVTTPSHYYEEDGLYDLGEAIAEKVGCYSSYVSHMDDDTFLFYPKVGGTFSVSLWAKGQNYIRLADIDRNRAAIDEIGENLKAMGFPAEFVFHSEWCE